MHFFHSVKVLEQTKNCINILDAPIYVFRRGGSRKGRQLEAVILDAFYFSVKLWLLHFAR